MSKKNQVNEAEEFIWPEFKSDRERIRAYSERYRNCSITEAFEDCYGVKLQDLVSEEVNIIPKELKVGNIFKAKILSIDKNKIIFDSSRFKTSIQSNVNLYKYEKFKKFKPICDLDVLVKKVDKDGVLVDPITPMIDSWMSPIVKDPTIQKIIPTQDAAPKPITVKNLQLVKGGFMGKAVIPSVSEFVGEDYVMDAFIPGSQIVLNITDDFEKFNGQSVQAFIVNYIPNPRMRGEMSLICSVKEYLKFLGECNLITLFSSWCEESDAWKEHGAKVYPGKVTGVINTSKKCGVFVEIPELAITGMVPAAAPELVNYKPHQDVNVRISGFDEDTYYDPVVKQKQHVEPYIIEDGILKKCNVRPILEFA